MEKIKNALEKAKQQQTGTPAPAKAVVRNQPTKFIEESDDLESIKYDTSAVVELDAAYLESKRIVAVNKHDPASWIFDSLRTQVLQKMEENNWRTLAIVSPTPESGKTFVAINLAISIAQQPLKTALLVDFDLRRPRIANYLGLKLNKSINELLAGNAELEEIMVNPGIPRLTILPTKTPTTKTSETLASKNIQRLVTELRERYDSRIVIFDLPPILTADDAMVLLPQVDCALLVVCDGMNTKDELDETMRLLSKTNIVGVVANKADVEPRAYYY
ncbi:Putative tyrosine-protein kinase YveL [Methylophilaceae bacterium]|nr:Putative tyrosine-protein kinase YveL [Methylophilaceae bacterium]